MFDNPGKKIKSFASFFFKTSLVVIGIYAVLIVVGSQDAIFKLPKIFTRLLLNASTSSAYRLYTTLIALLAAVWNVVILELICWLFCLLLSALGESFEMKMRSTVALQRIAQQLEKSDNYAALKVNHITSNR